MGCFVLLAAGRVVNLAVPILYKRVVDRLSYATGLQHPQVRPHQLPAPSGKPLLPLSFPQKVRNPADMHRYCVKTGVNVLFGFG